MSDIENELAGRRAILNELGTELGALLARRIRIVEEIG